MADGSGAAHSRMTHEATVVGATGFYRAMAHVGKRLTIIHGVVTNTYGSLTWPLTSSPVQLLAR